MLLRKVKYGNFNIFIVINLKVLSKSTSLFMTQFQGLNLPRKSHDRTHISIKMHVIITCNHFSNV